MKEKGFYDKYFYNNHNDVSYLSGKKLLPVIFDIIKPRSVVDVGCGAGSWLQVSQELGAEEVLGVEGPHMTPDLFKLDKEFLQTADLQYPLHLQKRYDLAMSLEVAEHLPESAADVFVNSLADAADLILFSAAIKAQLGTNHINEQMPEYWAKKFGDHGYVAVDFIRPKIWHDEDIAYWYRQNAILYVKRSRLGDFPELQFAAESTDPNFLLRIHPEKYFLYVNEVKQLSSIPVGL